jgi:hypothetical protein
MAKFFKYRCTACGAWHYVSRALAVTCPVCYAAPGEKCKDLRAADPKKTRISEHDERLESLPS